MFESKKMAEHETALVLYFDEMLAELESPTNILTNTAEVTAKPKPVNEYNQSSSFQAILFDINGLQLAIRSDAVNAILQWPETPLQQQQNTAISEAIMGVYNQSAKPIKVINTAFIVLPIEHRDPLKKPNIMIVFDEGRWALSCHKINAVTTLSTDDINWRKNSTVRPWLAGTSIKQSCSIISLIGLVNLIDS